MTSRVAVLASGGGSNLQSLIDHDARRGDASAARVALVVSNRADAGALQRAAHHGIAATLLPDHRDAVSLRAALAEHAIDMVVLAGYLKLVPPAVVGDYRGRMLNVHPALLPSFGGSGMYGRRVHAAVIASGARLSGPTVHFVDEEYDRGAIVAQWPVPVFSDDSVEALAARVLRAEHRLLPLAVEAVASGRLALGGNRRLMGDAAPASAHFALLTPTELDAIDAPDVRLL